MDIISAFIVVPKSDIVHPARCDAEEMISAGRAKWARQDSNLGPRDYESPALTAELQARFSWVKISTNGIRNIRLIEWTWARTAGK